MWIALVLNGVLLAALLAGTVLLVTTDSWPLVGLFALFALIGAFRICRTGEIATGAASPWTSHVPSGRSLG